MKIQRKLSVLVVVLVGMTMGGLRSYGSGDGHGKTVVKRVLQLRYALVGDGSVSPCFGDESTGVLYQYSSITVRAKDVPEMTRRNVREPVVNAAEAGLTVVNIEAAMVVMAGQDGRYDVAYFLPSHATLYRWKDLTLSKTRAEKMLPFAFRNAIDANKLKLNVIDCMIPDEVRAKIFLVKESITEPASE